MDQSNAAKPTTAVGEKTKRKMPLGRAELREKLHGQPARTKLYHDRLDIMFEEQVKLQRHLGVHFFDDQTRQQYMNLMLLEMFGEVDEIKRCTMYKNPCVNKYGWKKNQMMNREMLLEELVDLWHFMMNMCWVNDFTSDDFYAAYLKKNKVNHERKNKGY